MSAPVLDKPEAGDPPLPELADAGLDDQPMPVRRRGLVVTGSDKPPRPRRLGASDDRRRLGPARSGLGRPRLEPRDAHIADPSDVALLPGHGGSVAGRAERRGRTASLQGRINAGPLG